MDARNCAKFGKLLSSRTFWLPDLGTRGGTCISVSDAFLPLVVEHGVIMPFGMQYVFI